MYIQVFAYGMRYYSGMKFIATVALIILGIALLMYGYVYFNSARTFQFDIAELDSPPNGTYECTGTFPGFHGTLDVQAYMANGRMYTELRTTGAPGLISYGLVRDGLTYLWNSERPDGVRMPAKDSFGKEPSGMKLTCVTRGSADAGLFATPPIEFKEAVPDTSIMVGE